MASRHRGPASAHERESEKLEHNLLILIDHEKVRRPFIPSGSESILLFSPRHCATFEFSKRFSDMDSSLS